MSHNFFFDRSEILDPDAARYIRAVQAADGAGLEGGVKRAINKFVIGCKRDGIWDAIKSSCILAGARTLSGALVPLKGTAPTNFNFVSSDYDRKTGLVGNASTKYLDSNRNNNADPQNSQCLSTYVTVKRVTSTRFYMASSYTVAGPSAISDVDFRSRSGGNDSNNNALGFIGSSRDNSANFKGRVGGVTTTYTSASSAPASSIIHIFGSSHGTPYRIDARLAFYSIGEATDLALLDARISALITALGVAI